MTEFNYEPTIYRGEAATDEVTDVLWNIKDDLSYYIEHPNQ